MNFNTNWQMNTGDAGMSEYFHLYKMFDDSPLKWRMRFHLVGNSVTIQTWEEQSPNHWKMLTDSVQTRDFARGYWDQLVIDGWSVKV
jgi:hypothetical protein